MISSEKTRNFIIRAHKPDFGDNFCSRTA